MFDKIIQVQRLLFMLVFICLFSSVAKADGADDLNDFLKLIQAASDTVESFESDFVQEKHLAMFEEAVLFEGYLAIVRPNRLRWEFFSPLPSVLIFDGDNGIKCSGSEPPQHFQFSHDPIMKVVAEQLWLWLGGDYSKLTEGYVLEKKGATALGITPLDEQTSQFIQSISIYFNESSLQPEQVEIVEQGGDTTKIRFMSNKLNQPVADHLFTQCSHDG